MKQQIVLIACLCSAALVYALPISDNEKELDIINIPLNNGKELDVLTLGASATMSERNKRTIGILRDLFPELSKQVEDQVNKLVAQVLRTLGPTVLRTAIQGNTNTGTRTRADFDADFDDDDTIASDDAADTSGTRVKIELPTFDGNSDDDDTKSTSSTTAKSKDDAENETKLHGGDNSIDLTALNQQLEETIRVARQANVADNDASVNSNQVTNSASTPAKDQQASESKASAIDELTLDSLEDSDGEDRNKRQGLLGGAFSGSSGAGGAGGGGNAGGSGNFLFDIIRQTANHAARAVGTMYRYVAGTDTRTTTDDYEKTRSFSFTNYDKLPDRNGPLNYVQHNNIDRMPRTINNGLFSGSVQSQPGGDNRATDGSAAGEVDEDGEPKPADVNDGYTEGIPGPVTRLVVLANRGIANLINDLILRVASTSERLVNFKARLITALI